MTDSCNRGGYWYLATPYSKWKGGIEDAFKEAARLAGRLILNGEAVYSPIAHTHPVATYAGIDPLDHAIWMPADKPLFDASSGLLVANLDGWRQSYGVSQEIEWSRSMGRPVRLLDPATLASSPI